MKNCVICDKEFEGKHKNHANCGSIECKRAANTQWAREKRKRDYKPKFFNCKICDKECTKIFTCQVYCSGECKKQNKRNL